MIADAQVHCRSVALFVPDASPTGPIFHPANSIAKHFAAIAGTERLTEKHLQHIRALGFEVTQTNGQPVPIPHPWKGYQRKVQPEPRHILDDA